MTKPKPKVLRKCGCGCGKTFWTSRARKYIDHRHEQRAYRQRVQAAAADAGVPAVLTLEKAQRYRSTRNPHREPEGGVSVDERGIRGAGRRDTEAERVRVSLTLAEAEKVAAGSQVALLKVRHRVAAALERKRNQR